MSYTPTFLIKKEEFDKVFEKIKSRVESYWENRRIFFTWKNEKTYSKQQEYDSLIKELGTTPDINKTREKAIEEIEKSKEHGIKTDELIKEDCLADIFENHDGKEDFEINGNKFYLFETEYSSQAKELKTFCEKNNIPHDTNY